MDLIDLEDDHIDAEVLSSLAVTMENFKVYLSLRQFCINLHNFGWASLNECVSY